MSMADEMTKDFIKAGFEVTPTASGTRILTLPGVTATPPHGENPPATDRQRLLAKRAEYFHGSLDENQWDLAELACSAQAERVPQWDAIIGVAVGRAPRTVRGWAKVAEFRLSQLAAPDAPFGYWAYAQKYAGKLDADDVIELMRTALAEHASADQYAAELRDMLPVPEPTWQRTRARLVAAAEAMQAISDGQRYDELTRDIEKYKGWQEAGK